MRAMWPAYPLFWFVMSIGVLAGFILAYPMNVWLVANGLKHGLMTVRKGEASATAGPASSSDGAAGAMTAMAEGGHAAHGAHGS